MFEFESVVGRCLVQYEFITVSNPNDGSVLLFFIECVKLMLSYALVSDEQVLQELVRSYSWLCA